MESSNDELVRAAAAVDSDVDSPPAPEPSLRARALALLALTLLVSSIYAGRLSGPFVFDDQTTIVDNESIRSLRPLHGPLRPPRETPVAGRPVPNLLFAFGFAMFGANPTGFHFINLVLHYLTACVLLGALRRVLSSRLLPRALREQSFPLALAAVLLWAVHPITVEVVLYATQLTEVCVAFFLVLTMYSAIRAAGSPTPAGWAILAVVACALGMASKAVMFTAPVLVLLLDRAFFAGTFADAFRRRRWLYAGLCSTWVLQFFIQIQQPRPGSVRWFDLGYLAAQSSIVLEYLGLCFWPARLAIDYGFFLPGSSPIFWITVPAAAFLVAASGLLIFTHPRLGFAGAFVFGILAPTSTLAVIHTEVGAERRMYLPLAAVIALTVVAVQSLLRFAARRFKSSPGRTRAVSALLLAAATVALGVRSRGRTSDFQSELALWRSAVRARPENPRAHYNLGETFRRAGRLEEAAASYRAALARHEPYAEAHLNLGGILLSVSGPEAALHHIRRGAMLRPDDVTARYNLGLALGAASRFDEAAEQFETILRLQPLHHDARLKLAYIRYRQRRFDEALRHVRQILQQRPSHPGALVLMRQLRPRPSP
jgi:tetratricopeptide (TPR) repeat protein